jgi:hypothetical protein
MMFGRSIFLALALAAGVTAAVESVAQDAGVSGIPRGPGNAGGLNNSVNDPSGIGNATRIAPPPQPSIAVPAVPQAAPMVSTRVAPVARSRAAKVNRSTAAATRREFRRASAHAPARKRSKPVDSKFNICRGC